PAWQPNRLLTEAEQRRLGFGEAGACVYVKPGNGYGGHDVVRVEQPRPDGLLTVLAGVREHCPRDAILVQRAVRCPRLTGDDGVDRPAYWRVLSCFGELLPFWWDGSQAAQGRPNYRGLSAAEIERHGLAPVLDYVGEVGELCGLDWFSTELCLSEGGEPSRHTVRTPDARTWPVVAIDYVNDQCDVDVQSRWPGAPPDDAVRHVADSFAEAAWRARRLVFPQAEPRILRPAA